MPFTIDLKGKRAVVTGVTSGIGLGIAINLTRAGCVVTGCGTRPADSEGARRFLTSTAKEGIEGHYFQQDLSQADSPANLIKQACNAMGGIDILVSNAGRNIFKGTEECTESEWHECMELDLASHWRLARAALPSLEESKGTVIIISSNHSKSTIPGCFPYNVAKAGLAALVQSLAIEWGPVVRAVGIEPGFIDTEGNDKWFESFPDPAEERRRTEQLHPVGRIGHVDEIGALVVYLAGPHAGFISGTSILVDGGRSALLQDN
ncbi:MAG: SDR family NAD(P)-dependent oxidoreductase [Puniceicoccaceae bacterium]